MFTFDHCAPLTTHNFNNFKIAANEEFNFGWGSSRILVTVAQLSIPIPSPCIQLSVYGHTCRVS